MPTQDNTMTAFSTFKNWAIPAIALLFIFSLGNAQKIPHQMERDSIRSYYLSSLLRISDPVLSSLSKNELKKNMPVEKSPSAWDERTNVTYLEAFGRTLSGIAPWLEIGPDDSPEGKLREKYIQMARECIHNATDPNSPDYMNFTQDGQPLVDAAFFAQGLLRAPNQLWEPLNEETKQNVINALKATRIINPPYTNWLLFMGTVEAALFKFSDEGDIVRLEYALNKHMEWYLGDGVYRDGPEFHWDYYNSYVIHPMMLDILKTVTEVGVDNDDDGKEKRGKDYEKVLERAKRYAVILERLISPDGTYPPIGRSLAYRFGAFQLLSQMALWQKLPDELKPGQVRSALYAVIKKQLEAPETFDENGWLRIGFMGHQPNIAEGYISTGSLYLCTEAFLVLGLDPNTPFWTDAPEQWTQKKIWNGNTIPIDHHFSE